MSFPLIRPKATKKEIEHFEKYGSKAVVTKAKSKALEGAKGDTAAMRDKARRLSKAKENPNWAKEKPF